MNNEFSFAFYDDANRLRGLGLGYNRTYSLTGAKFRSGPNTGFSVDPAYRGRGVGQLLYNIFLEGNLRQNYPLTTGWYDTRHNKPGTAHSLFSKDQHTFTFDVPLWGKTLDYPVAAKHENLSLSEKAFKRVFRADELAWFLNYAKDGFATVCYSVKSGNTVCGLFFGYKSTVSGSNSLLFLDGVIFDATLSYMQKKMIRNSYIELR